MLILNLGDTHLINFERSVYRQLSLQFVWLVL